MKKILKIFVLFIFLLVTSSFLIFNYTLFFHKTYSKIKIYLQERELKNVNELYNFGKTNSLDIHKILTT